MHIVVYVEVANGCEGEVHVVAVLADVDAVFAVIQRHVHLLGRGIQRLKPDNGQCVVDDVRHSGLYHPHHVGKRLVVVAREEVFLCVHLSRPEGIGQCILTVAKASHLNGGARIHHLLVMADADIGHVGHVLVEAQQHRA